MTQETDLLKRVMHYLHTTSKSIGEIAEGSGVGYDTVVRIKKGEHDPGYSKVKALGDYFEPKSTKAQVKPKPKRNRPARAHA